MVKASPLIRSFNAGEFSPLMVGRTDVDKYPASCRKALNYVAAPQGPAIGRSGTTFINTVYDHAQVSALIPFVFSETDFYTLEFSNNRLRFFTENGLLTYAPVAATVTNIVPFKIDSAALAANIGDEVALEGFPDIYNLNSVVMKITNKVGTVYTLDGTHPALPLIVAQAARVYHIDSPYSSAKVLDIWDEPSLDVLYLLHPDIKPYKLERFDTYNWQFIVVDFIDGPYLALNEEKTTLSVSATGKATPNMTSNVLPSGVCSGSTKTASSDYYMAFDDPASNTDFWQSNTNQSGVIQYRSTGAPFICDGYAIYISPNNNADTNYTFKDYAPSNFTFEGSNNGIAWTVLDRQNNYVLYDGNKSVFIEIPNAVSYEYYRLNITSCLRNGPVNPAVGNLVMRSTASASLTITASATTNINSNQGFLATDVGRLIRIQADDGAWRSLVITARTNANVVIATLLGEPFPNTLPCQNWRLGAWSETTGYPNCAVFFDDRLWFGGSTKFPDFLAGSVTGQYENMAPTTEDGTVLDTSGIGVRLNARRLSRIRWLAAGKDGLLLGTGSQEYNIISSNINNNKTITPANIKANPSSSRGSAPVRPAAIDLAVLFVQRSGRTLREFAYNFQDDAYKSPSMSLLSSHLGVTSFKQLSYAAEPYSIVWIRRGDGTIAGLTYDRDEQVVGWHRHNFPDDSIDDADIAFVESTCVMPSSDQLQDYLWAVIRRTVNGVTVRYVEKLNRFWDFDMTLADAHYVDCALRYNGAPITEVYGLQHNEGKTLYGLADGIPVGPFVVEDGLVTLDSPASNIVLGIGFAGEGETSRLENGAQDGTAQGKVKRVNLYTVSVWDSFGGEIGVVNEDTGQVEYVDMAEDMPQSDNSVIENVELFTGILGPYTPAPGYGKGGSIFWRRKKESPLPFNIVSIMPQLNTQDR